MKKNKLFYKKRLMSNTITVISILVAAALVFGSGVSAIDINNNANNGKENMSEAYIHNAPDGLAPISTTLTQNQLSGNNNNAQEMINSNDNNYAPLAPQIYMYGYTAALGPHGEGPCYWDIYDPSDIIQLSTQTSVNFLAGGDYTCDERWLCVEYANGALYQVDPETGDIEEIGGGGLGLNGLAENPLDQTLYGAASYDLYKVNSEDGTQELIGPFGTGQTHIALAFDMDGTCYTWDVKFGGESYLYEVDLETGEATVIGGMGVCLLYAQDGCYNRELETLYLSAYLYTPVSGGYQATVDIETGEMLEYEMFEAGAEITASMFIQQCIPPEHDVGVKSIVKPADGPAVDPMEIQLLVKNYGNNSEVTDVQFEIIKCEAGPLLLEEEFDTWPPEGWEYYGYEQSNTNKAVGIPPEAYYGYYSGHYISNGYLQTPAVNATGYEKINVKFRMLLDKSASYSPYFYLHYRKNASSAWRDVSPWDNPITSDLGPLPYEIGCYGWGEDIGDAFQVRWYFGSYYYYLEYGSGIYIDSVVIEGCAGCAEYAELVEDAEIPFDEEVLVDFPGWTPSEWHNPEFQDTVEEYPLTAYTLLKDNNSKNDKKQRLLYLYYPFLHDVSALSFEGPDTGPAQVFTVKSTIKNVGQYDECCFKTHVAIAEIDFTQQDLLIEEYFPTYVFPPAGWTITNTKWSYSYSSYAGGSPYEARFYYYPSETGMFRLYTPPINTQNYGMVKIQFKHNVNHYTTPYTLRVETSPDGNTWTSVWDISPTGSVPAEDIEIITGDNVGSSTFHVSWTFDGYSWNINYWYVDNIVIYGLPIKEPEYEDEVCCESIVPGQEKLYQFDDWEPEFLPLETYGKLTYLCKAWTDMSDPEDNNRANDQFQKAIQLNFFHDVAVEVQTPPIGGRGDELVWDNGDTDGSNGYSLLGNPRRSILDDFEILKTTKIDEMRALIIYTGAHSQNWEVTFWTDDDGDPGDEIETMKQIEFNEEATGRSWFGYAEYEISVLFEQFKMAPGFYWAELWPGASAANTFWMIRLDLWRSQCWIDYADYGFMPGSNIFGVQADVSYQLWGVAGVDAYVAPGWQAITAMVYNLGTFPERDMTCYAEIYEFITDCENGNLIYEDLEEGIDILTPLTGSYLCDDFEDFEFVDEGVYSVEFYIEDDNDNFPENQADVRGIGVDDTPPVTFERLLDPPNPDGDHDWYVSDLTVTLTAEDPEIGCDVAGSGVREIKYAINGAQGTITGDTGSFDITQDGTDIKVEYWAIDNVGNIEPKHTFYVNMDQTVPFFTNPLPDDKCAHWMAWQPSPLQHPDIWNVRFWVNVSDNESGMHRVEMLINEGLHETNTTPTGDYYSFVIQWTPSFDSVTFTFVIYDTAGWFIKDDILGANIYSYAKSHSYQAKQFSDQQIRSL